MSVRDVSEASPERALASGPSIRVHGHFGEWVQGRSGAAGPVVLVTMRGGRGVVRLGQGGGPALPFDDAQLDRFARALGLPRTDFPSLISELPLGVGAGASTALLVALARGAGFKGGADILAKACLAVEGAVDPLMMPAPDRLVWASRAAFIVQELPAPPAVTVVGGRFGRPMRTDPADDHFDDVSDLLADWRVATERSDASRAAAVATASAERCTARRGPPDPMRDLARDLGALGHMRAHTGSLRGLIFTRGGVQDGVAAALSEAGLRDIQKFDTGQA